MRSIAVDDRCGLSTSSPSDPEAPGSGGLSHEEEVELAAKIALGDRNARNRLVQANIGLVYALAQHFLGRGLDRDDLVGEGHLGLIRAAEKFDPQLGTRFSTYAAYWIKAAIRTALVDKAPTIRLPAHLAKSLARWRRAERRLREELGRTPRFVEVADSLGLNPRRRATIAQALQIGVEHTSAEISDGLASQHVSPEDVVADEEQRAAALERLADLEPREQTVLSLHFGLGGEVATFGEIGRRIGVSRQRANDLAVRALRKLGDSMESPHNPTSCNGRLPRSAGRPTRNRLPGPSTSASLYTALGG